MLGRMCTSYWDHCGQITPWRCLQRCTSAHSAYLELNACAVGSSRAMQNIATALSTVHCGPCANATLYASSVPPQQAVGVVYGSRGMATASVHLPYSDVVKHFPHFRSRYIAPDVLIKAKTVVMNSLLSQSFGDFDYSALES